MARTLYASLLCVTIKERVIHMQNAVHLFFYKLRKFDKVVYKDLFELKKINLFKKKGLK